MPILFLWAWGFFRQTLSLSLSISVSCSLYVSDGLRFGFVSCSYALARSLSLSLSLLHFFALRLFTAQSILFLQRLLCFQPCPCSPCITRAHGVMYLCFSLSQSNICRAAAVNFSLFIFLGFGIFGGFLVSLVVRAHMDTRDAHQRFFPINGCTHKALIRALRSLKDNKNTRGNPVVYLICPTLIVTFACPVPC